MQIAKVLRSFHRDNIFSALISIKIIQSLRVTEIERGEKEISVVGNQRGEKRIVEEYLINLHLHFLILTEREGSVGKHKASPERMYNLALGCVRQSRKACFPEFSRQLSEWKTKKEKCSKGALKLFTPLPN